MTAAIQYARDTVAEMVGSQLCQAAMRAATRGRAETASGNVADDDGEEGEKEADDGDDGRGSGVGTQPEMTEEEDGIYADVVTVEMRSNKSLTRFCFKIRKIQWLASSTHSCVHSCIQSFQPC